MSNILNYFSNSLEIFKGFSDYYDLILTSDTKKSTTTIGTPYSGQTDLYVHIDTNNPNSYNGQKLISLNEWSGATIGDFQLEDVGLTAIDLGFTNQLTGITWTYSATTSSKKMEFYPILTGNPAFTYSTQTDFSGDYIKFEGGYFNGIYKFHDYPYEILPKRYAKGWTADFILKLDDVSGYGSSGNTGFFFYLGARAENKFWNRFSGETGITTSTGVPLSPEETYINDEPIDYRFIKRFNCANDTNSEQLIVASGNTMSDNIIGFRLTPEYHLGYRSMRITGYCDPSSATTISAGNIIDYATKYQKIYELKIDEQYTEEPIYPGGPISNCSDCNPPLTGDSAWVMITVKFSRDITYDTNCRLENGKEKNGTLTFYVNARPVLAIENFEEIIPDALEDVDKTKQQTVPFNIFLGGGSPGLRYSQTFGGPDLEDGMLPIQTYFDGSFSGGMSQFKLYGKPLDITEIIDNFKREKCRYGLKGDFGGRYIELPEVNGICSGYPPLLPNNIITTEPYLLTIQNPNQTGEIRYTLDGSEPTESSQLYSTPFLINSTTTIKAKVFFSGGSSITSSRIIIVEPIGDLFDFISVIHRYDTVNDVYDQNNIYNVIINDGININNLLEFNLEYFNPSGVGLYTDSSGTTYFASSAYPDYKTYETSDRGLFIAPLNISGSTISFGERINFEYSEDYLDIYGKYFNSVRAIYLDEQRNRFLISNGDGIFSATLTGSTFYINSENSQLSNIKGFLNYNNNVIVVRSNNSNISLFDLDTNTILSNQSIQYATDSDSNQYEINNYTGIAYSGDSIVVSFRNNTNNTRSLGRLTISIEDNSIISANIEYLFDIPEYTASISNNSNIIIGSTGSASDGDINSYTFYTINQSNIITENDSYAKENYVNDIRVIRDNNNIFLLIEYYIDGDSFYEYRVYDLPEKTYTVVELVDNYSDPGIVLEFKSYIEDGGNDLFDTGNLLYTNLNGDFNQLSGYQINSISLINSNAIEYTHTKYANMQPYPPFNNDGQVVDGSQYFGSGSTYFTNMYNYLFVLSANNVQENVNEFFTIGNLGADGNGSQTSGNFLIEYNSKYFYCFYRQVYGTNDPSLNQIIIVESESELNDLNQQVASSTDIDNHRITGIEGIVNIHFLLFAARLMSFAFQPSLSDLQAIANEFILNVDSNNINNTLENLNLNNSNITTLIPNKYLFNDGGINSQTIGQRFLPSNVGDYQLLFKDEINLDRIMFFHYNNIGYISKSGNSVNYLVSYNEDVNGSDFEFWDARGAIFSSNDSNIILYIKELRLISINILDGVVQNDYDIFFDVDNYELLDPNSYDGYRFYGLYNKNNRLFTILNIIYDEVFSEYYYSELVFNLDNNRYEIQPLYRFPYGFSTRRIS